MSSVTARSRRARELVPALLVGLVLAWAGHAVPAPADQEGSAPELPDVATMEADFERLFAAALDAPEDDPVIFLQTWSMVFGNAMVLERIRAVSEAGGGEPVFRNTQEVAEEIFERWRQHRPDSAGPDLFRALRSRDDGERRQRVLALLDRYGDDPLVIRQAAQELRSSGETRRATELAESFATRHPERSVAWRLLARDATGNQTRLGEVLERWARALPDDPKLVETWLRSHLPGAKPEATDRLLGDFFAHRPAGAASLAACLLVLETESAGHAGAAEDCVRRLSAEHDVPRHLAERSSTALEKAAIDLDPTALLARLHSFEPSRRLPALLQAVDELELPRDCSEALPLLAAASANLAGVAGYRYRSISTALHRCASWPQAVELFGSLLDTAPASVTGDVVGGWAVRVNEAWRGELPPGTAERLEARLRDEPGSTELFEVLDVAYQLAGSDDQRFDLLGRWRRDAPAGMRSEHVLALAGGLARRNRHEAAVALLEEELESGFEFSLAEALWGLYFETGGAARAQRFASELAAEDERWSIRAGRRLSARAALLREDYATAEALYREAIEVDASVSRELASELLATISLLGEPARAERTARRLCEETRLASTPAQIPSCTADLLTRAGLPEAASASLTGGGRELPEDLESLQQIASSARSTGRPEVAERALRRILDLDPENPARWSNLGAFLASQGRAEEAVELLERSRSLFDPPPLGLYVSAGRALVAAGEPRRGLELLIEGRDSLPRPEPGDWTHHHLFTDLREAYRAYGRELAAQSSRTDPPPVASAPPSGPPPSTGSADAIELRREADALHSGRGGRYDPGAARGLYERAAALGEASATFRLALLEHLGSEASTRARAEELHRRAAPAVERQAAAGDPYAQYLVGTALLVGLGGPADPAAARRWLDAAAEQGDEWALHNLAWMRETGRGFETPDPAAALAGYRRASEAGNTQSMLDFGRLTLSAGGSAALCEEGLAWLERSASAGNPRAVTWLGKLLFFGLGDCVSPDPARARPWLEAAVAAGEPGSRYDLGLALLLSGSDRSARERGATLVRAHAAAPDALAVETLAFLHATGIGVTRDTGKARALLAEAARLGSDGFPRLRKQAGSAPLLSDLLRRGVARLEALAARDDPAAAALLARLYRTGLEPPAGRDASWERIAELAREAALAGEADAMRSLSALHLDGFGVEESRTEADRWRRACAEAGDSFCMLHLGHALVQGDGMERDVRAGLAWLRRSAETGNWWATQGLARYYAEGWYGNPPNLREAAVWMRRLAELGDAEAIAWLELHAER